MSDIVSLYTSGNDAVNRAGFNEKFTEINTNAVPTARKINNKALSSDISLTAADVGAAPAASGFSTYTHTKTGSVHALTGNGVHIEFLATADYTQGDTFTVNGAEVTAKLQNGEPLQDKNFTSGSWVSALRLDGAQLTFASGGGGGINDTLAPLHTNFLATGGNARITLSFDEMPQEYSDVYKETHICLSSQRYPQGPNDYDKLVVVQPDGTYVITSKEVT